METKSSRLAHINFPPKACNERFQVFLLYGAFLFSIVLLSFNTILADTVSLSKNTAYLLGDSVVVTYVDADKSVSLSSAEILTTAVKVQDGSSKILELDMIENGINTGTFLATIRTGTETMGGKQTVDIDNDGTAKAVQGGGVTVYFSTSQNNRNFWYYMNLSFSSYNAMVSFDSDSYNLGSYAVITLADAERNTNIAQAESLLNDVFIQTSSANSTKVRMVETGADTGTFKGSIEISTNPTTDFIRIQTATGDTLQITYTDDINTTGSTRTVTDTALVTSNGSSPPTGTTGTATNVTNNSATLNGTVNANGLSTTAWFQYSTTIGSYSNTSSTQSVSGSSNTTVSIGISGLSSGTTYYYRIAAQNSSGTTYGSEMSFTTTTPSPPSTTTTTVPTTTTSSTTTTTVPTTSSTTTSTTTTSSTTTSSITTSTTSTTTSTTSTTTTTIPACTDSYESNDSFSAAYGPTASGSSYSGKICSSSDVDYFKITVARAGPLSLTLGVPSYRDYDLYLYNSSQSEVAYSSQGTGATDFITYLASTTGTYYIKVFGYNGDYDENQTYTLSGTWLSTASVPTVTTGFASNITTNSATLNGTVDDKGISTTAWFQYGTTSSSYSSTSSTQSVSGPHTTVSISISGLSSGTTYYYRIAAENSAGTTYGNEISFTISDASKPTGSVNINSGASYTNATTVTLNLSATDNAGITGYYSSTSSSTPSVFTPGWTSINSTTSYTADVSYTVSSGDGSKAVYVWYKDNSGNVSNTASDEITLDTIIPTIIITTPTSSSTYTTTSSTMNMDGTAFDNASGISSVTWSNSKGGNGTATGTTSWSVSSIALSGGDNTITVTAKDNAGNTGTDAIAVTYSGGTVASPTPTSTPTPTPTPKTSPSPTKTPAITPVVTAHPTPTPSPTPIRGKGVVLGFVYHLDSEPLLGVDVTIAGNNYSESTETDSNGYYEFDKLAAGDYTLTYEREGYETQTMDISLEEENVFVVDDVTMEEMEKGKIYGYVVKIDGDPIESVRLRLKGIKTKVSKNTSSDEDGFFEFTGLGADTYVIFAKKKRYKKAKATVKLEEDESKEIEIEMKRTSKRIKGLFLMDDGQ